MKAALLQLNSGTRPAANAAAVAELCAPLEVDFILTPEMTPLLQKDGKALRRDVRPEAETISPYQEIAREKACHFLLGSAAVSADGDGIANRSVLIGPDGLVIARYDKINLFEASLSGGESYREADSYVAGKEPATATIGEFKLGLSVCYDLRFPSLYSNYAKDEASIISVPSAFTRSTGRAHWETLLRARAIESGAWVLAPAQGGRHEDGRRTWGRTMAVSPWGEVVGCLDHDEPGVLEVELDLKSVRDARGRIPAWRQR